MRNIEHKLVIKSSAGLVRAQVFDLLSASCERELNCPGWLEFTLPAGHPALPALEDRGIVEFWRRRPVSAGGWTCEARCLFQDSRTLTQETSVFTARCPGPLWLISSRLVAYPPQISGRSLFSAPAGEIARELVRLNATADASTGSGRLRNGGVNWVTVGDFPAGGSPITWECSLENLLGSLQKLALVSKGDFDLEFAPPKGWVFRWYDGGIGNDRSGEVRFSLKNGSLLEPSLDRTFSGSKNAVIASCPDGEGGRLYAVSEGAWRVYDGDQFPEGRTAETWSHFQNCLTVPELESRAEALLERFKPQTVLSFQVLQTGVLAYGRDYFLGDRVSVEVHGAVKPYRIRKVRLVLSPDQPERIEIGCTEA